MADETAELGPRGDKQEFSLAWQADCQYKVLPSLSGPEAATVKAQLRAADAVAVDIETTGLDTFLDAVVGISLSPESRVSYYFPICHRDYPNFEGGELRAFIHSCNIKRAVFYNAKFDTGFLSRLGYVFNEVVDVAIYIYLLRLQEAGKLSGLKNASKALLNLPMIELNELFGCKKKDVGLGENVFSNLPINRRTLSYVCADADITRRLYDWALANGINDERWAKLKRLDHALLPAISLLEETGIKIDTGALTILNDELTCSIGDLERKIYSYPAVAQLDEWVKARSKGKVSANIHSPVQLRHLFYKIIGLPIIKTTRPSKTSPEGQASTDKDTLKVLVQQFGMQYPVVAQLGEWRELQKLQSSYVKPILEGINPRTGRIHPSYNTSRLITGRLSTTGDGTYLKSLNAQGIPKLPATHPHCIRKSFIPDTGFTWVSIDWSNIELRLVAAFSGDQAMKDELLRDGGDLHALTCRKLFKADATHPEWQKMRKIAKTCNFNLAYAWGIKSLQAKLKYEAGIVLTETKCWKLFDKFFNEAYPTWGAYKKRLASEARKTFKTTTFFGRERDLSSYYETASYPGCEGDRMAVNHPIQGTCADLMRIALVKTHKFITENDLLGEIALLSNVHDELNFEIKGKPGEERFDSLVAEVVKIMEWTPKGIDVPFTTSITMGPSWAGE